MTQLKFVSTARDCKHNEDIRSGTKKGQFIHDYMIMVDGVLRGQWRRNYGGRGYYLTHQDGEGIYYGTTWSRRSYEVSSQKQFENATLAHLESGVILTPEQEKDRLEVQAREIKAADDARRAVARKHRIGAMSDDMYALLQEMIEQSQNGAVYVTTPMFEKMQGIVNYVETEPTHADD